MVCSDLLAMHWSTSADARLLRVANICACIAGSHSSVASPICQEWKNLPDFCLFFLIFPLFFLIFSPSLSRFLANFSLSEVALCLRANSVATPLVATQKTSVGWWKWWKSVCTINWKSRADKSVFRVIKTLFELTHRVVIFVFQLTNGIYDLSDAERRHLTNQVHHLKNCAGYSHCTEELSPHYIAIGHEGRIESEIFHCT